MKNDLLSIFKEKNSFIHVIAAGGGTELAQILSQRPGSSAWLSGVNYPYSPEKTEEILGFKPRGYVNMDNAIRFAMAAYAAAYQFGSKKVPIGVGLEATLASEVLHRGDHRIHACVITPTVTLTSTLILEKRTGLEARIDDNQQCSSVVWNLLALAHNVEKQFGFEVEELDNHALLDMILERPYIAPDGQKWQAPPSNIALMPGAYNPPHDGHFGIANKVTSSFGRTVVHHLTIDSPHKPTLKAQDVLQRLQLLRGHHALVTTGDGAYIQKAERFPNTPIVLGTDALQRLFDPSWGFPIKETFDRFGQLGTTFYVSERPYQSNDRLSTNILTLKKVLASSPVAINEQFFKLIPDCHFNFSSTEIRKANGLE